MHSLITSLPFFQQDWVFILSAGTDVTTSDPTHPSCTRSSLQSRCRRPGKPSQDQSPKEIQTKTDVAGKLMT